LDNFEHGVRGPTHEKAYAKRVLSGEKIKNRLNDNYKSKKMKSFARVAK
jgi:hypothetical protein